MHFLSRSTIPVCRKMSRFIPAAVTATIPPVAVACAIAGACLSMVSALQVLSIKEGSAGTVPEKERI